MIIEKEKKKKSKPFFSFHKEFIWSFFLCFNLILPILNSLELSTYGTQGKSFSFVLVLCFLLYFLFRFNPVIYDYSINCVFSRPMKIYLDQLTSSSFVLTHFPRAIGVFYGICFLSFFLRFEMPDSTVFYSVNVILLTTRNLLVLPYLGLNSLVYWILSGLDSLIDENLVDSQIYSIIRDKNYNYEKFNTNYFYSLPLINRKSRAYNLSTQRNVFSLVRVFSEGIQKEQIKVISKWTVGTTFSGSVGIQLFAAGVQTDNLMDRRQKETTEFCDSIINDVTVPRLAKDIAKKMKEDSRTITNDYYENAGSTVVSRGFNRIISGNDMQTSLKDSSMLFQKANRLSTTMSLDPSEYKNQQWTQFLNYHKIKDVTANSCLECLSIISLFLKNF